MSDPLTTKGPLDIEWEIAGTLMPGPDPFQGPQPECQIVTNDRTQQVWLILNKIPTELARHIVKVHNEALHAQQI